jgi:hypothetical protein
MSWSQASSVPPFLLQTDVLASMGLSGARRRGTSCCPANAFPRSPRKSTPVEKIRKGGEEEEEEDVGKAGADGFGDVERDEPLRNSPSHQDFSLHLSLFQCFQCCGSLLPALLRRTSLPYGRKRKKQQRNWDGINVHLLKAICTVRYTRIYNNQTTSIRSSSSNDVASVLSSSS